MTPYWETDSVRLFEADALECLAALPAGSVDLAFFSPPYERARLYLENGKDLGIARNTEEWVKWMVEVFQACLRVCKGLVACVCEGQTRKYRYTASPFLLAADLHRAGVTLRKPPIYHRVGIPGSGGPDWLRNDWEAVICATNGGKLPWSENTAAGKPPKFRAGGPLSYRTLNGERVNHKPVVNLTTSGATNGDTPYRKNRSPSPAIANPGNVIKCKAGGGNMGSDLAHENEAPFPESLATVFVRSFCPPGGTVLDCFAGSGTTGAVAIRWGRKFVGCDVRQSQCELTRKRISCETPQTLYQETP